MTINVMLALINHYCLLLVMLVLKCDVSINKSLLLIVSDAGAKVIGPCPKKPKMDNIQIIDKLYNPPQDFVIDMNAIVADLLNNLLPTKIEDHQITNLMLINSLKI